MSKERQAIQDIALYVISVYPMAALYREMVIKQINILPESTILAMYQYVKMKVK